jgi:hypothetical protein
MRTRRTFLLSVVAGIVAMGVVATAVADELLGIITKVDVAGKKITVEEQGSDKEVVVTINDDTEVVTKKGAQKVDLEKLEGRLTKVQDAGKKGIPVKITHEKGVASKLEYPRKAGARKKAD